MSYRRMNYALRAAGVGFYARKSIIGKRYGFSNYTGYPNYQARSNQMTSINQRIPRNVQRNSIESSNRTKKKSIFIDLTESKKSGVIVISDDEENESDEKVEKSEKEVESEKVINLVSDDDDC